LQYTHSFSPQVHAECGSEMEVNAQPTRCLPSGSGSE
jgi:hypothetical protein